MELLQIDPIYSLPSYIKIDCNSPSIIAKYAKVFPSGEKVNE